MLELALCVGVVLFFLGFIVWAIRNEARRRDAIVARIRARPVVARYRSGGVEVEVHGFPRD